MAIIVLLKNSINQQNENVAIFSEERKVKKRKKEQEIKKTPIKQSLGYHYEIRKTRKHNNQFRQDTENSLLYTDEEDELTADQSTIPKKHYFYEKYKNKKKIAKVLIKTSNKHEKRDDCGDIFDLLNTETSGITRKRRKKKKIETFFQEASYSENSSIGDCIEVDLSGSAYEKPDELYFLNSNIESFQKKYDSTDMISDDPLTSPFINLDVQNIKKKRIKPLKTVNKKTFDNTIEPDPVDHSTEKDLIIVESTPKSSENFYKEISYEYKKKNTLENKSIINNFKNHILEKLTGRKYAPIIGLDLEYKKLRELLYQTINMGESNSCLIIGPKSCGKSNILDTAIVSLSEFSSHFFVVRLNGIIQTDDKLALREIARQLNVEMNLDVQENVSSFSDNLFKILTILSHPKELNLINDDNFFDESDTYHSTLSSNNITSVSVIFILDNFDLFIQHHRQTLLYNLFDISQTKKAPIAVIGLTSTLDSVESLEKRVKSRFSHRIIQIKYPDNLELFIKICRAGLTIDYELSSDDFLKEKELQFIKDWNRHVDDLFEKGNVVYKLVEGIFMTSKDVKEFYSHCIIPVTSLSASSFNLQENMFFSRNLFHSFTKTELLNGISLLQFSLLVCAAKIDTRDTNTFNFNMVYKEYHDLVTKSASSSTYSIVKNSSIRLWERDILLDAWEKLCDLNFLQPSDTTLSKSSSGLDREYRMYHIEITLIDLISYMDKVKTIPTILKRWSKEVIA
ncbi:unnamed protein product [Pneumocystis jirovecii]|uniref:Origin recognition complex subunit 4 C-terminal domain-containing protein n=1 Tax=Pneumocystis jirovecii TaxID=42068 RepID=L0PGJ8_PNEJI|nr:unnamed protein product [Pneumocystis jirovecii]